MTAADELMEAVRDGRAAEVMRLALAMTTAQRRACFPELKALRKGFRAQPWAAEARRAYPALQVAGAVCQTGAAAVAGWLAGADMRWGQASPGLLLHALADRDRAWLGDVVHRLAGRPVGARVPYELMAGLVRLAGCPVPVTEAYVRGWVGHIGGTWQLGGTVYDRLRRDPHLAELAAALFRLDDIGSALGWSAADGPDGWTGALARLTTEGALDREETVDACVARLLRGGRAADQRLFLRLLGQLRLTREEERARTADWSALAADAVSPVAAHAQSVLAALALDGELPADRLAEVSAAVLFRPEKKLVRAQLVLLGKVLARDAGVADALLPALAQAFGHEDSDVQERALKLAGRHLARASAPQVRGELAEAAAQLIPALCARAARELGLRVPGPVPAAEELLPPAPQPARVPEAPRSPAELAEEVGALLASGGDVTAFERALDGLVRHAHQDRDALLTALEPVLARRWWTKENHPHGPYADEYFSGSYGLVDAASGLDALLATLRGRIRTSTLRRAAEHGAAEHGCVHQALTRAFEARLWEVALHLRTRPLPFLLSTPTWSTGLLEPEVLVERLDAYRRLSARVAPADFAQALLRVRRSDRAAAGRAAERAAALGTAEGARLAAWLTAPAPVPAPRRTAGPRVLVEYDGTPQLRDGFPAAFGALGDPVSVARQRWYCYHGRNGMSEYWLALLPELPELVAARLLRDLSAGAVDDGRGAAAVLPRLAEADGAPGAAVHLGVAYGLGARHPEDRLAAVDALLVLAARGRLDTALLGTDLGELVRDGAVKPLRLAESVRTAASTGANATIWGVLRHTLPALLAGLGTGRAAPPVRGLGDLLAVAAECAERSGARGELPGLDLAADRPGSSRLATQARRLRTALREEEAAVA